MGMSAGSPRGGPQASINMTPMIDVLLVLLIIFMVVQGQMQRGLAVQLPPPPEAPDTHPQPAESFVLEVLPDGGYRLNQQPVAPGALRATLAGVFGPRARRVLFVKGDERASYAAVVGAVDASRAAGVTVVGLVPRAAAGG